MSAFQLLDHFAKGKDIAPFLAAYTGFNTLRVWPYVPAKDWGDKAWDVQPVDVTKRFLEHVGAIGWTVELTLLTDDDSGRLSWAQSFLPQLAASPKPTNVLIEIANEPTTRKNVDTKALKSACDASGFVYESGNYEKSELAFGKYGVAHTPRDSEWPRKAHDLIEYCNGGGPHAPSNPAHKYPWVGDEPAKTQDVAAPAPPLVKPDDWRAYGGTAALLGAGATFHSETGKFAQLPTSEEAALAAAMLESLTCFPADAPLGPSHRPVENSLRTYVVGNCMVRVRPTTPDPPQSGWTRIGVSNVLWRR